MSHSGSVAARPAADPARAPADDPALTPSADPAAAGVLLVGTRGSTLARRQADIAAEALAGVGIQTEIRVLVTEGDRRPPDTVWGEGAFVGAIEAALIDRTIDVGVHSAKDLPTAEEPGLRIAAYLPRADPRDVLVVREGSGTTLAATTPQSRVSAGTPDSRSPLERLAPGSRVGTDSPRRAGFLRAVRPDLVFHPLSGNVDTRLRRLDQGATDALVLAAAGLERLGRSERIGMRIPADLLPPAPGQGALAVQVRGSDRDLVARLAALDDRPTRIGVEMERALLAATGGGCRTPVGALATVTGSRVELLAGFASPNLATAVLVRAGGEIDRRDDVVREALARLADQAVGLVDGSGRPRVISTGGEDTSAATRLALVDRGLVPEDVPAIEIEVAVEEGGDLARLTGVAAPWDWVVVTSANAVRALVLAARAGGRELVAAPALRGARWAAVGPGTAAALGAIGIHVDHRPRTGTGAALGDDLPLDPGARVLLPRSDLADDALPRKLAERGAVVEPVVAYRTIEAPAASRDRLRRALERRPLAAALSSASAVRGLLRLAEEIHSTDTIRSLALVAIGPSTAAEIRRFGLEPATMAASPGPGELADATAAAIPRTSEVR